jgi:N-acetylneuraminic acid mutarotase
MPTARSEIAVTQLDGRIYVAGGIGRLGTTSAFEVYDPSIDTWRPLAPLPEAAHHLAMTAAGGRIYVTGGYGNMLFKPDRKSAWVYDPETDVWQPIADMPGPRAAHKLVSLEGKIYAVGGVGPDPTAIWVYDPKTQRWDRSRSPLPTAREHLAAVAAADKLYVIAGRWSGRGNLTVVEAYDPSTDQWTSVAALPAPRGGHTAATIEDRIHVAGGEDLGSGDTFSDHWAYDPASDRWIAEAPMPTARHGLDSTAHGQRWFVVGGGTGAGARTFFTLTNLIEVYVAR